MVLQRGLITLTLTHLILTPTKLLFLSICVTALLSGCAKTPVRTASSLPSVLQDDDDNLGEGDVKAPEAKKLRDDGIAEYLHGNYPKAITLLETADALSTSHSSRSLYLLYYCYLMTGDSRHALKVAQTIATEQPYSAVAYEQLGLAELSSGHYNASLEYFQKALDFEAHPTRIHFYKGIAEERLKNNLARDHSFLEAEKEYHQVLKTNPKDFSANYELASMYLYWNHAASQLAEVPQLIQNCRDNFQAASTEDLPDDKKLYASYYLPLLDGIYLYRKGAAAESSNLLAGTIAHLPDGARTDLAEIYYYLAQDNFAMGHKEQARTFFDKSIAMDPEGIYSEPSQDVIRSNASLENISP